MLPVAFWNPVEAADRVIMLATVGTLGLAFMTVIGWVLLNVSDLCSTIGNEAVDDGDRNGARELWKYPMLVLVFMTISLVLRRSGNRNADNIYF